MKRCHTDEDMERDAEASAARDAAELAALRAEVERLRRELAGAFRDRAEARELLRQGIKYVVEDRATTRGTTRLARWVDRVAAALGEETGR